MTTIEIVRGDNPLHLHLGPDLIAQSNVDQPGQWLITDQKGRAIYGVVTVANVTGEVTVAPRWQVGLRWGKDGLMIFKQKRRLGSPFEDDREQEARQYRMGKRLNQYTSLRKRQEIVNSWKGEGR